MKPITPPFSILTLFSAFLLTFNMLGQLQENDNCKFVGSQATQGCDDSEFTIYTNPALSIDPSYLAAFEPVVINIYFWDVRNNDGDLINNALSLNEILKKALKREVF